MRAQLDAQGKLVGSVIPLNTLPHGGGHSTRTIVFGADSAMYVSVGSIVQPLYRVGLRARDRRALQRGRLERTRVLARSAQRGRTRDRAHDAQAVGIAERARRHPARPSDLPPEEINILQDGKDYGWPYCYSHSGAPVPNPEYDDAGRCATTVSAALEMQAHSAPLGMTFLDKATLLPAEYHGDLLVAFHGSWDRDQPTGAKVVRVHVSGGVPTGDRGLRERMAARRWLAMGPPGGRRGVQGRLGAHLGRSERLPLSRRAVASWTRAMVITCRARRADSGSRHAGPRWRARCAPARGAERGQSGTQNEAIVARADTLLIAGRIFAAESLYYIAVRRAPRDPVARLALGRYLAQRGALKVGAVLMEEARYFGGDPTRDRGRARAGVRAARRVQSPRRASGERGAVRRADARRISARQPARQSPAPIRRR